MVSTLVVLGLVMVLSASAVVSIKHSGNAWSEFNRQARSAAAGLVLMFVAIRIDYHHWRTLAVPAVVGSLMALALLAVPGLGINQNNATRWLDIGVISFQPSEVAKLALLFFAADFLSRPRRDVRNARSTLVPVLACTALFAVLIMLQPHFGNTLILGVIALTMLFWAGTPIRLLSATAFVGVSLAGLVVWSTAWRRQRLLSVFDPWSDPGGDSFQLLQSLHAITVGGIRGTGIGDGLAKWGFVPFAHSDFIFAVIAEELGILGAGAVILLYLGIGVVGSVVAVRAPDRLGMLLAAGITTWIFAQASLNLGSVMGLLPTVGVTLPLVSHGGTSLVMMMVTAGILLNVARQTRRSDR
ncbi:MAG: putative lipid II flippase FtsW [Acidimicrobiia bacterium]|nr:putative lipid II flippase FtsW [Acidimicrobiia bacterium]